MGGLEEVKMWEILDISIPAVVLFPLIAISVVVWMCLQQNARSSDVRRADFQRLRRLAMEEHARAERELEQEYTRHKPAPGPMEGMEYSSPHRRAPTPPPPSGNGYEWRDAHESGGDALRRRKQVEDEEHLLRRKQADSAFNRRRVAEEEEERRKLQEADLLRRKQAAAEELRAEIEERKRRDAEEEARRRQTEEQDWQRRRADLEAQARREAEEERRRLAEGEEEERQRRWKREEALRLEALSRQQEAPSPRRAQSAGLTCVVCDKPTKTRRRCSRCKSMNYCSKDCQVQHWSDGHKLECRPVDAYPSPRSSVDGDTRNFSDFNSPRS